MSAIQSNHVVKYFGMNPNGLVNKKDGSVIPVAYTIQELLLGGELFEYVNIISHRKKQFNDDRPAAFFGKQILTGIKDLHALGVSHRDVKPDNIVLHPDPQGGTLVAKLIDLGCLAQYGTEFLNETLVGTSSYLAPEVIK